MTDSATTYFQTLMLGSHVRKKTHFQQYNVVKCDHKYLLHNTTARQV